MHQFVLRRDIHCFVQRAINWTVTSVDVVNSLDSLSIFVRCDQMINNVNTSYHEHVALELDLASHLCG